MKVFSVVGITQSGKTTTIENIIKELRRRNYSVGSVKEIHFETFSIDKEGSNTHRHKKAGSQLVTARGNNETDILFQEKLPIDKILEFYDYNFVVLEGVDDKHIPKIICAHNEKDALERIDSSVFAISGRISNTKETFKEMPIINSINSIEKLVDLIEKKALNWETKLLNIKFKVNKEIIDENPYVHKTLQSPVLKTINKLEHEEKGEKIMTLLKQRELKGIEKGIEQGMLLGEFKRAKESAKNMLINKEPMEKIIMYTGLNKKEIDEIKKELYN